MESTYWHRQTKDKPLFPDLLWSRPENKRLAGKLLIIGGNLHGFAAPAEAYNQAVGSGIGTAKVLLPDALQKTIGQVLENAEFAPSNKSGSFSKAALAEWLDYSSWADGILIAGELGRNSETAVVLESFVEKYSGQITITKDAADYFTHQPQKLLERAETTLVVSIAQLQKICTSAKWIEPVKFGMTAAQLADLLHQLTSKFIANIIVMHNELVFVASKGKVSTTKLNETEIWRVKTASNAAVWWLQNPAKPFEAITSSLVEPKQ